MPYGNWSPLIDTNNIGGTCVALLRRRLFEQGFWYSQDMTSYEDWLLYRELHARATMAPRSRSGSSAIACVLTR